jgi:hypothetical protein
LPFAYVVGDSSSPWYLVSLGVAGSPVAYIEQKGDDNPDEPPTRQPYVRDVHDHVDKGSKREEDDAE